MHEVSKPKVVPFESYSLMPWKNGKGVTREIYRIPGADGSSLFRLSMATLAECGAFSVFPGTDRIIVPLDGQGFALSHYGATPHWIGVGQPYQFKGDDDTEMTALDATTLDLNAMVQRQWGWCQVEVNSTAKISLGTSKAKLVLGFFVAIGPEPFASLWSGYDELVVPRLATCLFLPNQSQDPLSQLQRYEAHSGLWVCGIVSVFH